MSDDAVFSDALGQSSIPSHPDIDPVRQAAELKRLSDDFKTFKETYGVRRLQDSYRFAEIAENEDYKTNLASSNRVMVNGRVQKYIINLYHNLINRAYVCASLGLKSALFPTDSKEQHEFVSAWIGRMINDMLKKDVEVVVKVWTVAQRRYAKDSTQVPN